MRYGFVNNFEQALAQNALAADTLLILDAGADLLTGASADLVYVLTLFSVDDAGNETAREIVHVTGVSENTLTVVRGQDGTTAREWPLGAGVSQRLTAGVVNSCVTADANNNVISPSADGTAPITGTSAQRNVVIGSNVSTSASDGVVIGEDVSASARGCVTVGPWSSTTAEYSVAIGATATVAGENAIAVGYGTISATGLDAVCLGNNTWGYAPGGVALGAYSQTYGEESLAVGYSAYAEGQENVAVGPFANAESDYSVSVGPNTESVTGATNSVVLGHAAAARAGGVNGVAIGSYARVNVDGGLRINALSYLPAAYDHAELASWIELKDASPAHTRQSSQQVVIATDPLDLTDAAAAVTLALPANTLLFVDAIDVVVIEAATPGGTPEIQVGPDDTTPASYLAAAPVAKTAVGGREAHDPLTADGVTTLRASVVTAGTGTYKAKLVFRGYVMEV